MAMSPPTLAPEATHAAAAVPSRAATQAIGTTFSVILSLSFCHLLNDMMQSLVPALYPILKTSYGLSFSHSSVVWCWTMNSISLCSPDRGR